MRPWLITTWAVRRHEVNFRSSYQILFYFFGRNGPRDKTSGHKLSSRPLLFVLGGYELSFRSRYQILLIFLGVAFVQNPFLCMVCPLGHPTYNSAPHGRTTKNVTDNVTHDTKSYALINRFRDIVKE